MLHEQFELKNAANSVESAVSSSKMLQIPPTSGSKMLQRIPKKTNGKKKSQNNSGPLKYYMILYEILVYIVDI